MLVSAKSLLLSLAVLAESATLATARKVTVVNKCGTTVYAAYGGNGGKPTLANGSPAPGGWEMAANAKTVLNTPAGGWRDARIWVRSGDCGGNVKNCQIGVCKSGGLDCDGTEYGTLGATVAEFNIDIDLYGNKQDWYDVSMVEGFTIPIKITPSAPSGPDCVEASCGTEDDIIKKCDKRLAFPQGADKVWGCANPCTNHLQFTALAGENFDWLNSPSCCTGSWTDQKCTHDVVPFYSELKSMCKNGYVYAKDDLPFGDNQTAVWSCTNQPDYEVTLCAGSNTGIMDPPSISSAGSMDPGRHGALNSPGAGGYN